MYVPPVFKVVDLQEIRDFIKQNGFGILINNSEKNLLATHIPIELINNDGKDYLQGHVSKANPQWKSFGSETQFLAIFQGPHTYISPTWYTRENVPTWNYAVVHIYGKTSILEEQKLLESLNHLVDKYESQTETNFSLNDLSASTLKRELRGIVGFELEIDRVEAAFKMSQNRDQVSYNNIIDQLSNQEDQNQQNVADIMKSVCPFKSE